MKRVCQAGAFVLLGLVSIALPGASAVMAADQPAADAKSFPRSLDSSDDAHLSVSVANPKNRVKQEPFNLVATLIFQKYLSRRQIDAEFEKVATGVDQEVGFRATLDQQLEPDWDRRDDPVPAWVTPPWLLGADSDCQCTQSGGVIDLKKNASTTKFHRPASCNLR
jgi:hypothetical protein